jgi:hypothetical protein
MRAVHGVAGWCGSGLVAWSECDEEVSLSPSRVVFKFNMLVYELSAVRLGAPCGGVFTGRGRGKAYYN